MGIHALGRLRSAETQLSDRRIRGIRRQREGRDRVGSRELQPLTIPAGMDLRSQRRGFERGVHVGYQVVHRPVVGGAGLRHRHVNRGPCIDADAEEGVPGQLADYGEHVRAGLEHERARQALGRLRGAEAELGHRGVRGVRGQREGLDRARQRREFETLAISAGLNLGIEARRSERRVDVGHQVVHRPVGVGAGFRHRHVNRRPCIDADAEDGVRGQSADQSGGILPRREDSVGEDLRVQAGVETEGQIRRAV